MVLHFLSQSTLDLSLKNNLNRVMKNLLLFFAALTYLVSCQSSTKSDTSKQDKAPNTVAFQTQVRTDKKRQAEQDLAIRSFPIDVDINTVAFGSCADQDQPQPIWATIEKNRPELMLMLGDNVYASSPEQKPISEQYNKLRRIPEYRSIRANVPFMATWDDHDFGQNDGGESNPEKAEAKVQFLRNWPYVKELLAEGQSGIWHSKMFTHKKNSLQVIMLDTRSDRADLIKNEQTLIEKAASPKPYVQHTDTSKRFLSEKQWAWLEKELSKKATFRIIASSVQLIANEHQFEKWGNFPHERDRFFDLLKKLKIKNAVVISGDRHMAAIAKKEIRGLGTLYDITSSGLNKPAKPGNVLTDASYIAEGYGPVNFGLIKINWATGRATVEIRSLDDKTVQSVTIPFKH